MKKLMILGISGNIGEQALDVLSTYKKYHLVSFSLGNRIEAIPNILKKHKHVSSICVKNEEDYLKLKEQYPSIKFYYGDEGLLNLIKDNDVDLVLNALVGFVGLLPTLEIIKKNENIALANKETLVVGGELILKALKHSKSKIIPVDSEHSAIYKCLKATKKRDVAEILITASGGAFRDLSRRQLARVSVDKALQHPTWKMGKKVTIDSASMLNKGFEIIEAYYLFRFPLKKIKVLMHKESHVHSILHLKDGTYLGEVNEPSMKNPIAYSLKGVRGPEGVMHVNNLNEFGNFTFSEFDPKRYPMVKYVIKALRKKGIMPCVLNATDEIAVQAFIDHKISFLDIEKIIKLALKTFANIKHPSIEEIVRTDKEVREWAKVVIDKGAF